MWQVAGILPVYSRKSGDTYQNHPDSHTGGVWQLYTQQVLCSKCLMINSPLMLIPFPVGAGQGRKTAVNSIFEVTGELLRPCRWWRTVQVSIVKPVSLHSLCRGWRVGMWTRLWMQSSNRAWVGWGGWCWGDDNQCSSFLLLLSMAREPTLLAETNASSFPRHRE